MTHTIHYTLKFRSHIRDTAIPTGRWRIKTSGAEQRLQLEFNYDVYVEEDGWFFSRCRPETRTEWVDESCIVVHEIPIVTYGEVQECGK